MSETADTFREDDEIGWGTLHYEAPDRPNGHPEVSGWITSGCFEHTDAPAVVVVTTADGTPEGEPESESLFPMDRVLEVAYDFDENPGMLPGGA